TFPSFHAANENVTFALPKPASSGTRTGPWKRQPQQKWSSVYRFFTGAPPGVFGGNSTSTTGKTPLGKADVFASMWLRTTTQQPLLASRVPTWPRRSVGLSPVTRARASGTFQDTINGPIVSGPWKCATWASRALSFSSTPQYWR